MWKDIRKILLLAAVLLGLLSCSGSSDENGDGNGDGNGTPTITTLASGLMNPVGIAVDAASVYWTESQDGSSAPYLGETRVKKVGLNGGAVTTLVTEPGQPNYVNTWGMAIDANSVYWIQSSQTAQTLKKVALNGGPATTLAINYPMALALDASFVYYSEMGALTYSGTINRVGKNGGGQVSIAGGQGEPRFIAVNASGVYWLNAWDGRINKTGISGGAITTLVTLASNTWNWASPPIIAADANYLYFIDYSNGSIKRIGLNGGTPVTLATSNIPVGLAVDATNVYWTDQSGHIYKVALAGGSASNLLVTGSPTFIALDSGYVYWLDGSSVRKTAKW